MSSRRMIYPVTLTAKLAQFPFAHFVKNSTFFQSYLIGLLVSVPIFYKLTKISYSPASLEKAAKYYEREHKEHEEHLKHLL